MTKVGYKQTAEHVARRTAARKANLSKMKRCPSCGMSKDRETGFYKHKNRTSGYCIECSRGNNEAQREIQKDSWVRRTYGISLKEYKVLLEDQNNACAICKREASVFKKSLAVDHCHDSGKIRGLLCGSCNRGIGLLQESAEVLTNAVEYLKR